MGDIRSEALTYTALDAVSEHEVIDRASATACPWPMIGMPRQRPGTT